MTKDMSTNSLQRRLPITTMASSIHDRAAMTTRRRISEFLLLLLLSLSLPRTNASSLRALSSNIFALPHAASNPTTTDSTVTIYSSTATTASSTTTATTATRDNHGAMDASELSMEGRQSTTTSTTTTTTSTCTLSDGGFYGTLTRDPLTVSFLYQASIRASDQVVRETILPVIDRAMVQGILPSLFVSCNARRTRRSLQSSGIIGISSQPLDSVASSDAGTYFCVYYNAMKCNVLHFLTTLLRQSHASDKPMVNAIPFKVT
jgi:hypothetical protein